MLLLVDIIEIGQNWELAIIKPKTFSASHFFFSALTLKVPNTTIVEFENTVDPDNDLQCLPSSL